MQPELNHDHATANLKVVLLIFVLVLVGALGYLVWAQNNEADTTDYSTKVVKKTATNEEGADVTKQTIVDPTADWKTYSNTDVGFSVKYPADYTILDESATTSINIRSGDQGQSPLNVSWKSTTKTLDQYIAELKESLSISGEVRTLLDGATAYEAVSLGAVSTYSIYALNNGWSYELLLASGNNDSLAANKAALSDVQKLMLASFKFTK